MAGTHHALGTHLEYRLIRIAWDEDHTTRWAVYMGSQTEINRMATKLRGVLKNPGGRRPYPRVDVMPFVPTVDDLFSWAHQHAEEPTRKDGP